LQHPVNSLIFR